MCAHAQQGHSTRKEPEIGWFAWSTMAATAVMVALLWNLKHNPDSELAHLTERGQCTVVITVLEHQVAELEESVRAVDAERDRKRQALEGTEAAIRDLPVPYGPNRHTDLEFAKLVLKREGIEREIEALETRRENLAAILAAKRNHLTWARAERARHVEAVYSAK